MSRLKYGLSVAGCEVEPLQVRIDALSVLTFRISMRPCKQKSDYALQTLGGGISDIIVAV
jgi:hypothetical protein